MTRRTVIESSTTNAKGRSSLGKGAAFLSSTTGAPVRTNALMSRISTILPSPRIVAPATPRILASCGPIDFTTISRLASISSVNNAAENSPARTRMTGTKVSSFGSHRGLPAEIHAEMPEAIVLLTILVGRLALTQQILEFPARNACNAFDGTVAAMRRPRRQCVRSEPV